MSCQHLIIVAGLPCSGKSHLIAAIEADSAAHVTVVLELDRSAPLHTLHASDGGDELGDREQVLLHFDLYAQQHSAEQRLLQLTRQAVRLSFLTVVVPAAELRVRHRVRLVGFLRSLTALATWRTGRVWFRIRRHTGLYRLYRDDDTVLQRYATWIAGSARFNAEHWVVDCSDEEFRCVRAADTPVAHLFGAS